MISLPTLTPLERLRAQRALMLDATALLDCLAEQVEPQPHDAHRAPVLDARSSMQAALLLLNNDLFRAAALARTPDLRVACAGGELACYPQGPDGWAVVLNAGGVIGTIAAEGAAYRATVGPQISAHLLQTRRTAALWVYAIWAGWGATDV